MYVFEVLNPEGFVEKGEKLHVQERGPFIYKQRVRKLNVTFNETEDTATFRQWTTFEFDSEVSWYLQCNNGETEWSFVFIDQGSHVSLCEVLSPLLNVRQPSMLLEVSFQLITAPRLGSSISFSGDPKRRSVFVFACSSRYTTTTTKR